MKILLVEDDPNKISRIQDFVVQTRPEAKIELARSYVSALRRILESSFDCLLLDMSLPMYEIGANEDGFKFEPFAGRFLLREMKRKSISIKTIIVTQYESFGDANEQMSLPQLSAALEKEFGGLYVDTVYYNPAQSDWRPRLAELLGKLK